VNFKKIFKQAQCYGALMRVDKPVGILLLLWPTLWALAIAGVGHPDWTIVLIFIIGTVLMRSAGCVLNDIADSQFDGHVERTKLRPLVTQQVSKKEAYFLASGLVLLAFLLVMRLNILTIIWSVFALIFAVVYPYTKRFLAIPQAFLGIAFGIGIPMAFTAVTGAVPMVAWLLMLANIFWAIAYDTIYAMVDREDDLRIGIRSSAITFGRYDVLAVMFCYAISLLLIAMVGVMLDMGFMFYLGLTMALGLVFSQYCKIQTRDRALCFQAFKQSHWFGFLILLGCIAKYADSLMGV
jgi:4-hydroxybenzoate polyprenyltransferase